MAQLLSLSRDYGIIWPSSSYDFYKNIPHDLYYHISCNDADTNNSALSNARSSGNTNYRFRFDGVVYFQNRQPGTLLL